MRGRLILFVGDGDRYTTVEKNGNSKLLIVPAIAGRKKRYRFRGGLIEKFAVWSLTLHTAIRIEKRERVCVCARRRSFYTPVNALITKCFLGADVHR